MRDKFKKISSLVAGVLLCGAMATFAGCSDYSPKKLQGDISGAAQSNGGFVVQKGEYTYFINGSESNTANNTLGKVEKGALVRIKTADLQSGNYDEVETVVPALFVAGDYTAGIFLYGDYVYFATPATEKNRDGTVANSYLNFKRAKLDGSSTEKELKEYFFRVEDNTTKYRFVEADDGTVYCMYVENSTLYSFNTKKKKKVTLVKGASSEFFFDESDPTNPTVYYTMAVTYGADSDNPLSVNYNQVYAVKAWDTATVNEKDCSYTTSYGYTYDFDKKFLKDEDEDFDAGDYTEYPYVNLGQLVLDGVGSDTSIYPADSMFNHDENTPATPNGYVYTVQGYHTGGLYLSRADVNTSGSDGENAALYYLADSLVWSDTTAEWASILENANLTDSTVAWNTTTANADALYQYNAGKHSYFYVDSTLAKIYRVHVGADGSEARKDELVSSASGAILVFADDTYLYYYMTTDKDQNTASGGFLYRVDYTGDADDYRGLPSSEKFTPQQILNVDCANINDAWYAPEFVGNTLLYCNAQAIGSVSYNYVYAVDLAGENGMMTYAELDAFNQKYADVMEHINDLAIPYDKLSRALKYYFYTGETKVFDDFIADAKAQGYDDHYRFDAYELETFAAFTAHTGEYETKFKDGDVYYDTQSYYYNQVGGMKSADEKAIAKVWTSSSYIESLPEAEEDDDTAKTVWMIVGIVAGSLVVIAAVTTVIVYYVKKKRKLARDYEATRVKKRAAIDVSDDKSIDVYADSEEQNEDEESQE